MNNIPVSFSKSFILPLLAGLLWLVPSTSYGEKEVALFLGNSFCDYNALNKQVEAMYIAQGQPAMFKRETFGGASWKRHWEGDKAQKRINDEEEWTFVVLQNHSRSSLSGRTEFDAYGKKFIDLVKTNDAEPVLFMTWARADQPEDQAIITEAYSSLGHRNGIKVAPVGLAFEKWIQARPDVPLHIQDNNHPTAEGSYLAACVIYATTTGKSPVGLPNIIEGANWVTKGDHLAFLSPVMAKDLQETAWAVVQAYTPEEYSFDTPLNSPPVATVAANAPVNVQAAGSDIRINFGGADAPGWNKVGGAEMPSSLPLVNADGEPTQHTLQVVDGFEAYENPKVVAVPLTGDAVDFEGAKSGTLFINRKEGNPTAAVDLSLDPEKIYHVRVWASRSASGRRWAKYTIAAGAGSGSQFLAAGGGYGTEGNASEVLVFPNVQPAADGSVKLALDFPAEGDPEFNVGDFVYLTGMIISEDRGGVAPVAQPAAATPAASNPPTATTSSAPVSPASGSDIRINFGGDAVDGWNKVGGAEMQTPIPLVDAAGDPTGNRLQIIDEFEDYENPKVVAVPLTGDATGFEGAKSGTLFLNREKDNSSAAVQLFLQADKSYQFRVWASRASNGRRWAKYTVVGSETQSEFLAAGGDSGSNGNPSETLIFQNVRPNADGVVTLHLDFPVDGDSQRNLGPYVYLTGLIISEE